MPQYASISADQFKRHEDKRGVNVIGKFPSAQWRAKCLLVSFDKNTGEEKNCFVVLEAEGQTMNPAVYLADAKQLLKLEGNNYVPDKTKSLTMSRDENGVISVNSTGSLKISKEEYERLLAIPADERTGKQVNAIKTYEG